MYFKNKHNVSLLSLREITLELNKENFDRKIPIFSKGKDLGVTYAH